MRGAFGLIGLLATLVMVGFLARQQLKAVQAPLPIVAMPVTTPSSSLPVESTTANPAPRDPSQPSPQIQQQMKQALEGAMQARPVREEQ